MTQKTRDDEETRPDEANGEVAPLWAPPLPAPVPNPVRPGSDYTPVQGSPRSSTAIANAAVTAGQLLRTAPPAPAVPGPPPRAAEVYMRVTPCNAAADSPWFVGVAGNSAPAGGLVTVLSGAGVQHLTLMVGGPSAIDQYVVPGAAGQAAIGAVANAIGIVLGVVTAAQADGTWPALPADRGPHQRIPLRWQANK